MLKLLNFLKPYRGKIIFILFLLFLQALTSLFLPALMSNIIDQGVLLGQTDYIIKVGLVMLVAAIAGSIFMIIANLYAAKVALGFSRDLRASLFVKIETFSLSEFNKFGTSSLITRTTNDITQVQQIVLMALRMMATTPLMIIGGLTMALITNIQLSVVLLISIPILIVVIALIGKFGIPLFKSMQTKLDHVNLVLRENLTGIRVIRAFNKVPYEQNRFKAANLDLTNTSIKVNKIIATLMPLMMLILNLTTVTILWLGGQHINQGHFEVGSLIAFIQYVMQMMMSLVMLTMMFILIPRGEASAARIYEVLSTPFEIEEPMVPHTLPTGVRGEVTFKDVSFYYPGSNKPALSHISFTTAPGKTTAIIGGTGSGKSTLISLIPRFYDATTGDILINGENVKNISQHLLREKVGLVPQKAILFSGSIRDNMKYGKDDASDEEIWAALDIAQATEFVSNKEGKLDSPITQGGSNVSGGQRQRLSIARALVRRPEVYVFDDSFSALDFKTDAALRKALKANTQDAAIIVVAQRISSIMDADEILVLVDGELVGQGTHTELLNHCEVYKEIALSQLSKEELENGK